MPQAMPGAMLGGCSEQSTQRNATDKRNERLQDPSKSSQVPDPRTPVDNEDSRQFESRRMPYTTHADREFTEFLRRVAAHPVRLRRAERWVEPIEVTRIKEYDQDTERRRLILRQANNQERKAS